MEQKHSHFNVEFKNSSNALAFSGYASKFNGLDAYNDRIVPGAYKNTIADRDRPIQLRWNHYGPVIGKFTSIKEDSEGLFVEGELTKGHSEAENAAALLKHGAISGMSIGYIAKEWEQKGDVRELKEIELHEISIVESPADNQAHVTDLKSVKTFKEIESVLRVKHGVSQREATAIVAAVKRIDGERQNESDTLSILNNFKLGE